MLNKNKSSAELMRFGCPSNSGTASNRRKIKLKTKMLVQHLPFASFRT